jgi:stress-induced morphogen
VAREYSEVPPVPPADGLHRRGAFIMPTRETLPAYAAHFQAKNSLVDTVSTKLFETDPQTERIRKLAATVTADELLSAHRTIKPALQKSLSKTDLHELALTLATIDKVVEPLTSDVYRPARTFYPRDNLKPEKA